MKDTGEYEDEEARYGAVDRRNERIVYGSKTKLKKFSNFHAKIEKNAFTKISQEFLKDIGVKGKEESLVFPNQTT